MRGVTGPSGASYLYVAVLAGVVTAASRGVLAYPKARVVFASLRRLLMPFEEGEDPMIPRYLGPDEGENLLGESRTLKLTPAETGGKYLLFETSHAPGARVPPHFHYDEDEAFYVLAGRFDFILGETCVTATSGACAFAPRGTVHAFTCAGLEEGRLLITVTPGLQHEAFMRELDELTKRLGQQPDQAQVVALALKHGWGIVPTTG